MFNFLKKEKVEDNGVFVLFDIGGTKTRVAASRDGKTFDEPKIAPTPKNFDEAMAALKKLADEARAGSPVKALSGGVPGVLNRDGATIFKLPNLPEWNGKPIKAELERIFNAPAYIENDTALVGLGEARSGAGRGYGTVAYITVSTGIGGVRIVDGFIDRKTFGFEPGWQIINFSDFIKNRDSGHLGEYVSGWALEEKFGEHFYKNTDPKIIDELTLELTIGLYNSVLHWSPEIVVLGGSLISGEGGFSIRAIENKLRELLAIFPEIPDVKKAELGSFGGLHGALEFIGQKINN